MVLQNMKLVIRPSTIIEYIWAMFIILNGNSVFHADVNHNYHFPIFCTIFSLILFMLAYRKYKINNRRSIIVGLLLLFYFSFYFIIRYDFLSKEIYLFGYVISLPILFLYFVMLKSNGEMERPFYCIENVVLTLAILSLAIWICGPILNLIEPNSSMTIGWGKVRTIDGFYGIQYITQFENLFGNGFARNTSFFCEGPMFSLWLSIALCTEMFLKESSKKWKVILLIVTIFTTTSMTGVLAIVLCFILTYFLFTNGGATKKQVVIAVLAIIVLPGVIFLGYNMITQKMTTASYMIRMQDYVAGFLVWKQNPILGSGFGNLSALQKYVLTGFGTNIGFSNSVTAILGTGGLWNFAVYILSIIASMFGTYSKKKKRVSFSILYCFLTITTIFFARYIAVVFIAFGLASLPIFCENGN